MSTHIAWICSDIVAGVASYLPAADITTLFNAGTRALNCVLQKCVDGYLALTARDVDLFYTYMNRFQYIRSVFIKGCRKIDKMKFKMPPLIKRFVAEESDISNLEFGANVEYIIVDSSHGCTFTSPPIKSMSIRTHNPYNGDVDHVTHLHTHKHESPIDVETYPRLRKIYYHECPSSAVKIYSDVKLKYICDDCSVGGCKSCNAIHDTCWIFRRDEYNSIPDAKHITKLELCTFNSLYNFSTLPPNIKSLKIYARTKYDEHQLISQLPSSVIDISTNIGKLTEEILMKCAHMDTVALFCDEDIYHIKTIIDIVSRLCNKIQINVLEICFSYNTGYKQKCIPMNNYHMSYKQCNVVMFERITPRK